MLVLSLLTLLIYPSFEGTSHVATEDLGVMLRGLGKNVTERQINDFINTYDKDGSGKLDFTSFYSIIAYHGPHREVPSEEQVLENLKIFDTYGTGKLSTPDLVRILLNMGENMEKSDVEHLVKELDIDGDGNINIKDFVAHMLVTSYLSPT